MRHLTIRALSTVLLCAALTFPALMLPAAVFAWDPLTSCRPTWDVQPSPYHVNSSGYSEIDLATVRQIFRDSFEEWGRPCCSGWTATDAGTTTGVAEDGGSQNIFSFRESSWPGELGDPTSTLAVTLTTWGVRGGRCSDLTADMTFNAANHRFATNDRSDVDLQAVTTHECGHWLGLAHSGVRTATMWPSYSSEEDRSLHSDDETGVCSLYPGDCGCDTTSDCDAGDVCEDGSCVEPPCASDRDCDVGLECDLGTGDCFVPPCRSDSDCAGAQVCDGGVCTIDADCPTCVPCDTIADCGGGDWQCASDGTGGFCTRMCDGGTDCPGNSACFDIEGQSFAICLNEDAGTAGVCHIDYVCTEEPAPCDGVTCVSGEICNLLTGDCEPVGGDDGCIICDVCESPDDCPGGDCFDFGGATAVCSMECESVADCPPGTDCLEFSGDGGTSSLCVNPDVDSDGVCPSGFICEEEPTDPCDGIRCPSGESCDPATGDCVDDGSIDLDTGVPDGGSDAGGPSGDCAICDSCSPDSQCDGGTCLTIGAAGTYCTIDCEAGGSICPGNTECFDVTIGDEVRSLCLNSDAGVDGICHADFICIEVTTVEPDGGGVDAPDAEGSDVTTNPIPLANVPTQNGCVSSANGGRLGALWAFGAVLLLGGTRKRRLG